MSRTITGCNSSKKESSTRFRGWGWPATMELLSPLDIADHDPRQSFKMIICPSCASVHEGGGICLASRHRHDEMDPANPTNLAVRQFWDYYHGRDDSILQDQFNPFVKETVPPLLLEAYADSKDSWGWCSGWFGVPYPCVTRTWTEIKVRVLDVAPYTVTLIVKDNGARRQFQGIGDQWFSADIDIDYWSDKTLDYTVRAEAVDAAGNWLNPAWEQVIKGWFGQLIDILASVGAAIANAVMAALSFLIDIIMSALKAVFQPIVDFVVSAFKGFADRLLEGITRVTTRHSPSLLEDNPEMAAEYVLGLWFFSDLALALQAIFTVLEPAEAFLSKPLPFLSVVIGIAEVALFTILVTAVATTVAAGVSPVRDDDGQQIVDLADAGSFSVASAVGTAIPGLMGNQLKKMGDVSFKKAVEKWMQSTAKQIVSKAKSSALTKLASAVTFCILSEIALALRYLVSKVLQDSAWKPVILLILLIVSAFSFFLGLVDFGVAVARGSTAITPATFLFAAGTLVWAGGGLALGIARAI